jgi:hypothetical protein
MPTQTKNWTAKEFPNYARERLAREMDMLSASWNMVFESHSLTWGPRVAPLRAAIIQARVLASFAGARQPIAGRL